MFPRVCFSIGNLCAGQRNSASLLLLLLKEMSRSKPILNAIKTLDLAEYRYYIYQKKHLYNTSEKKKNVFIIK